MREFLVVVLEAPLASFGEEAGNSQRGTVNRPSRSTLLGLAGAALGILRADAAGQRKLSDSFSTSTRTLSSGVLVRDYHTYQSVPQSRVQFATRREALASGEAVTSITEREYRCGGLWQAAYASRRDDGLGLEQLAQAFLAPRFALWLGRKSCPLSAPLSPRIILSETLSSAFDRHAEQERLLVSSGEGMISTDDNRLLPGTNAPMRHNRRNDEPVSRSTWTFTSRDEWEFMTSPGGLAPGGSNAGKGTP